MNNTPDAAVFLELAGLPAAGKTTTAALISKRVSDLGLRCAVVPEAAARSPLSHLKRNWRFNAWTLCQAVTSVLEHHGTREHDVVVLDRGLVDALCWIRWFRSRSEIDLPTASTLEAFARVSAWFQVPTVVAVLRARFETALSRRGASGRIVNAQTFEELQLAYRNTFADLQEGQRVSTVHFIDTDNLSRMEVAEEVMRQLIKDRPGLAAASSGRLTKR
jgi:thymidylate kinase